MSQYRLSVNFEHRPPPEHIDKDRLQRIRQLERLRERRFHDFQSVKHVSSNGFDEYGKRLENDMKTLKEIKKDREQRASSPIPRALSPLPPLFDISPDTSPKVRQNLFFGNEAYTKTRLEELKRMREENGHNGFSASEGLNSAVDNLKQVNERLGELRLKSSALQKEIQEKRANNSIEEESSTESFTIPDITVTTEEAENVEE